MRTNNMVARKHGSRETNQKGQVGKTVNGILAKATDGTKGGTKEWILFLPLIEVGNLLR